MTCAASAGLRLNREPNWCVARGSVPKARVAAANGHLARGVKFINVCSAGRNIPGVTWSRCWVSYPAALALMLVEIYCLGVEQPRCNYGMQQLDLSQLTLDLRLALSFRVLAVGVIPVVVCRVLMYPS